MQDVWVEVEKSHRFVRCCRLFLGFESYAIKRPSYGNGAMDFD
jgi:hypothetical protein